PGQATPQATPYPAAQKMVQQAVQPIARQALPGSSALAAAANSGAVQEALTRTLTTVAGAASAEGSSFFSLSGVGQAGPGGGLVLLLLGVLASGLILLRRDGPLSWASCEMPKPSSALLLPLGRPGWSS